MLPVAQVLGIALIVSTLVDVLDGSVGLGGEIAHLPELLSVPLVWLLAVPSPQRPQATRDGLPLLAPVDDVDQRDDEAI